jgi:hypothetical protein
MFVGDLLFPTLLEVISDEWSANVFDRLLPMLYEVSILLFLELIFLGLFFIDSFGESPVND